MRRAWMWGLGLVVGLSGCRAEADALAQPAHDAEEVPVRIAAIQKGPIERSLRGTGTIRPKREIDLAFKVGGVVSEVRAVEGTRVRKGDVLARVDPTEVRAAVVQSEQSVAKAERDLERVRQLHASGSLAVSELQNAETAAAVYRAGLSAAMFNLKMSVLVAPEDGRVERRMLEPGEIIGPGRPVFRLGGMSKGSIVRAPLSDRDAMRAKLGMAARVVVDAPQALLSGHISQIASAATPGTGAFDVEITIDDPREFASGLTAKVDVPYEENAAAIVPVGAIASGQGDRAAVFVVDKGVARRKDVRIAFLAHDRVALQESLDGYTDVVEAGVADLVDGAAVRIVR